MTTLYRDTSYSLNHLIEDIKVGTIALPDIQRPFVWSAAQVRELFDSMYRGYPIGTIMLWETGAEAGTRQIGLDEADRAPHFLIVDGQQRLTSLYAVLTGRPVVTKRFDAKRIRLAFRPSDESFEVTDAAIERDPEFIPDITALWAEGYRATVRKFLQRLAESKDEPLSEAEEDLLEDRIDRVHDLGNFRFQVIALAAAADEEQVAEIFVRINSKGVQLNQADFILTLMSVHWEKGRRELEAFSREAIQGTGGAAGPKNPFIEPSPDQMLRVAIGFAFRRARLQHVYSILRGKDLETGVVSSERRDEQFQRLAEAQEKVLDLGNFHEFLKCIQGAGFRSKKMITSNNAVIFSYVLWLIGRFDFGLEHHVLRPAISRWFFMAHTTARYTSSPESQLESDLGRLAGLPEGDGAAFIAELDRLVSTNFTNDYWEITLPNRLDTSASGSPALSAYLAALNLLDAEVLFSDLKVKDLLDPSVKAPRGVERHHLFPKKYLATLGVTATSQVNAIANMAFLDWSENASISDRSPLEYWPAMTERVAPDRLKRQALLHALPVGWEQLDYPTFLERRRVLIARVVREGFATLWGDSTDSHEATVEDLIAEGESQTVEFKSTARWSLHTGGPEPKLEHLIVKTVCGFLNAEGGSLLIGVDNDGNVLGLDNDFATPSKGSGGDGSEFWVRIGNATKQLHGDDMVEYQKAHWG